MSCAQIVAQFRPKTILGTDRQKDIQTKRQLTIAYNHSMTHCKTLPVHW